MNAHIYERDKFFYISRALFPIWPYPSRYAIGISLKDFYSKDDPVYKFRIDGIIYEIDREKANELGNRYKLGEAFRMPNMIPMEEFTTINEKQAVLPFLSDKTADKKVGRPSKPKKPYPSVDLHDPKQFIKYVG